MSGGLNKAFRKAIGGEFGGPRDPHTYLRNHLLNFGSTLKNCGPGIYEVNLTLAAQGRLLVDRVPAAGKSSGSCAFTAYWCPASNSTGAAGSQSVVLQLGARYFFTDTINGCRLQIKAIGVRHLEVTHHYADSPGFNAVKALPVGPLHRERIWHNDAALDTHGNSLGLRDTNAIGALRNGAWEFHAQAYAVNGGTPLPQGQVTEI